MSNVKARLARLEQRTAVDRWTVGNRAVVVMYQAGDDRDCERAIAQAKAQGAAVVVALPDNGREGMVTA